MPSEKSGFHMPLRAHASHTRVQGSPTSPVGNIGTRYQLKLDKLPLILLYDTPLGHQKSNGKQAE